MSVETRRQFWKYMLGGGIALIALYFALPTSGAQDILYSAFGLGQVVCILLGIRWFRPADRLAWYLLAGAALCNTIGDNIGFAATFVFHATLPSPGPTDVAYLLSYPLLAAGILRLAHDTDRSARREDHVDAAVVALGVLALAWHFLMASYVSDHGVTFVGKVTLLAYPILDVVIVFILCRALIFNPGKRPFEYFLTASVVLALVADFVFDYLSLHNTYVTGSVLDAAYLLEYLAFGVAALHPSMGAARLSEVVERSEADRELELARRTNARKLRMPFVAITGFIPPTLLLMASLLGVSVNIPVLATLTVIVSALILIRVNWLIHRISDQATELSVQYQQLRHSNEVRDALERDLRHQAFHDQLTGLANRALLHDRLGHALASTPRTGRSVAILVGDLDGFKLLNDTHGHEAGDAALIMVAEVLQHTVRPGDTVARPGGDEFAILMEEVDDPRDVLELAQRIVRAVKRAAEGDPRMVGVTMSAGIAVGDASVEMDQLLNEADAAMYLAKTNGKNRVQVFQPAMRARMVERAELSKSFAGALERSEFFLDFQPIFSLATGQVLSFEALVRWNHPRLGRLSPRSFIPVAEETGFIVPLGRWVMQSATEHLAAWSTLSDHSPSLSLNLSKRQLGTPGLVEDLESAMSVAGARSDRLMVEVKESVLMSHVSQVDTALAALRSQDVRVAVDNFGTGYSALRYLERCPVDLIKIDRSFVNSLSSGHRQGSALVATMVGLAHSLDLTLVAEGIEHEEQLDQLIALGCEQGQGFLMQRPFDPRAAIDLVRRTSGHPGAEVTALLDRSTPFPSIDPDARELAMQHLLLHTSH